MDGAEPRNREVKTVICALGIPRLHFGESLLLRAKELSVIQGGNMAARKNKPYLAGELEVILSLAPTSANIRYLSELLARSEKAIEVVYKIAFEHGPFGKDSGIQEAKILAAKNRVGISIGRKSPRSGKV